MKIEELQYPVGKFKPQENYSPDDINRLILEIQELPAKIETLYKSLSQADLDTPYRPGGWTARQVLHHIPDSHLNAYIRVKWTITEETPTIKAYDEKNWAETPETKGDPAVSVELLKALHAKWVSLLRGLSPDDLQKSFIHPETGNPVRIDRMIHLYAWHGEHHLGHLKLVANKSK